MTPMSLRQPLDHAAEHDRGVPVEKIPHGIRHGIRNIELDTDIRPAMTGATRKSFAAAPSEFDPQEARTASTRAACGVCQPCFESFGRAGLADRIGAVPPVATAQRRH